ncbi:MAG: translation initiation factor IF-6 [Candidatus Heimdallarchaeota archaeon]|nr:translation initiation factor IF-6 [Candidatus Heimdallarchaeota archaeon]
MDINALSILGNSSIGIFGYSTDTYGLFPYNTKEVDKEIIINTLQIEILSSTIVNSNLIGLFITGNDNHLLVPELISDSELTILKDYLKDKDVEVSILDSKLTALGNLVVANNKIALISPEFDKKDQIKIEDFLDVEIVANKVLNSNLVGSMIFRNVNGLLAHPLIEEEELEWISKLFNIKADVVTVNRGTPFPRPGIIANTNGILVGSDTTGPEIMRIFEVLS